MYISENVALYIGSTKKTKKHKYLRIMDLTEGNQPKTMENLGTQPQKKEVIEPGKLRVIKRNGVIRVICSNPKHKQRQG